MTRFQQICRAVAPPVALAVALTSLPVGPARAAMVTTNQIVGPVVSTPTDRDRVVAFVQRDDVRRQMEALGVNPDEATARVAGLSDAEIRAIAGQLDQVPAGQDAIGSLIGAAVFIFLVLLLTDLLGLTDVFPFVRR